jgi:hypothetical protein
MPKAPLAGCGRVSPVAGALTPVCCRAHSLAGRFEPPPTQISLKPLSRFHFGPDTSCDRLWHSRCSDSRRIGEGPTAPPGSGRRSDDENLESNHA